MASSSAKTVAQYLDELPEERREVIAKVRQVQPDRYTIRGSVLTDGQMTLESKPSSLEINSD